MKFPPSITHGNKTDVEIEGENFQIVSYDFLALVIEKVNQEKKKNMCVAGPHQLGLKFKLKKKKKKDQYEIGAYNSSWPREIDPDHFLSFPVFLLFKKHTSRYN